MRWSGWWRRCFPGFRDGRVGRPGPRPFHGGGHVIDRAIHYRLSPVELARLEEWRTEIAAAPSLAEEGGRGAGESGVILSRERFVPSEGVLIDAERVKRSHPEGQSST